MNSGEFEAGSKSINGKYASRRTINSEIVSRSIFEISSVVKLSKSDLIMSSIGTFGLFCASKIELANNNANNSLMVFNFRVF